MIKSDIISFNLDHLEKEEMVLAIMVIVDFKVTKEIRMWSDHGDISIVNKTDKNSLKFKPVIADPTKKYFS